MDNEIFSKKLDVEAKTFFFDLKKNPKGKYLKISELSEGRRDSIVIPEKGIDEFINSLKIIKLQIDNKHF